MKLWSSICVQSLIVAALCAWGCASACHASGAGESEVRQAALRLAARNAALIKARRYQEYATALYGETTSDCVFAFGWTKRTLNRSQMTAYEARSLSGLISVSSISYRVTRVTPTANGYSLRFVTRLAGTRLDKQGKPRAFDETNTNLDEWIKQGGTWKVRRAALIGFAESVDGVTYSVAGKNR